MTPNHIQFFSDRERIYAKYHAGKLTKEQCQRKLNALDDPEPQYGWTAATLVGVIVGAVLVLALK